MPTFEQSRMQFQEMVAAGALEPLRNKLGRIAPPTPQVQPYPVTPNSFLRSPLPATSVQQPDQQRQWQTGSVPQGRVAPFPARFQSAGNL
jgi:hypothetical protein